MPAMLPSSHKAYCEDIGRIRRKIKIGYHRFTLSQMTSSGYPLLRSAQQAASTHLGVLGGRPPLNEERTPGVPLA
jgi:hypothetical protein